MKMGKYILATLVITGLIGFTGCDESDDDMGGALPGNWLLVYDYVEGTFYGETYLWEKTYDDIFSAMIIQFTETTVAGYYNYRCSDEWGTDSVEPGPYTLEDGNKIIITWYYDETTISEHDYILSGNELTLSRTWTDSSGTGSSLMRLEKYTGSFPPSEWTTALYNDTYEPDDDVASATSLTVGSAEQNHTLPINDVDWFTFSAQSGTSYIIATTGVMDPELYLYNADGDSMLAYNDDSYDENARISWTCRETGTYSVKVLNDTTEDCGEYGISVTTGSSMAKASKLRKEKKTMRHRLFHR